MLWPALQIILIAAILWSLWRKVRPGVAYWLGLWRIRRAVERMFTESRSLPETPENRLFRMRQIAEVSEWFAEFVAGWNRKYPAAKPRDCEWYRIVAFKTRQAIRAFECGDCERAEDLWREASRYAHEHRE